LRRFLLDLGSSAASASAYAEAEAQLRDRSWANLSVRRSADRPVQGDPFVAEGAVASEIRQSVKAVVGYCTDAEAELSVGRESLGPSSDRPA
jgi:hypothetical protein